MKGLQKMKEEDTEKVNDFDFVMDTSFDPWFNLGYVGF